MPYGIRDLEQGGNLLWLCGKKQGGKCAYCGREGVAVAVDHVVPRNPKHGPRGSDSMKNLVVVCTACNSSKGNLQPEE